jgi:penicillin-binding protein 1A
MGAVMGEIFKGGSTYGGSSITQQLVKNVTGERDRKYTRKIKEIIRALALETKLSKQQILELYLNTIYLGHGCNGVESAARIYFDKTVSELTLAESASIAGITQYPALYDPYTNKEENIKKQRLVLGKMLELGYIDQEDYDEAVAEELKFKKGEDLLSINQSYFADQIVEDVIADLCQEYGYSEAIATKMVYDGGLHIYTTADKNVQNHAEEVFENENNYPASGGDDLQAAIVITEPSTGHVKAMVGGRGKKEGRGRSKKEHQAPRQPSGQG